MTGIAERGADRRGGPSEGNPGRTPEGDGLAERLSDLARSLEDRSGTQETLDGIVVAAVGTVPGAQHASISAVRKRREVQTLAATDDLPRTVDQAQYDCRQGPCLDTLYEQETVRLPDMASEERWKEFSRRAAELGVRSMLSVQLFVEGDDLGALNLFSAEPDAFGDESEHVALLFASHAAVAMSAAQESEQLKRAVSTRQLIGQAQGILMERFRIDDDRAFGLLVRASQHTNRRLVDVAGDLARGGQLPG